MVAVALVQVRDDRWTRVVAGEMERRTQIQDIFILKVELTGLLM